MRRTAAARRIPGITQTVLTQTLRTMESDGLEQGLVHKEFHPQHVEYRLTSLGDRLQDPLAAICDRGAQSRANNRSTVNNVV